MIINEQLNAAIKSTIYIDITDEIAGINKTVCACEVIVDDIAIQFAEFRNGVMSTDAKNIIRNNPDDYYKDLLKYFKDNIYKP